MNNSILVLLTGVGAFAAGWFASKSYYKAANDKEIAEMKEHYKEKLDEIAEKTVEEVTESPSKAPRMTEKPPLSSFRANSIIKQYENVVEPYRDPEEDAEKEEIDPEEQEEIERLNDKGNARQEKRKEELKMKPRIITREDYGEEDDYDQVELLYFDRNDLLTTDDEEQVEDVESLVGDALTKYGFKSSAEDEIFVRNYKLRTDYHIHKVRAE